MRFDCSFESGNIGKVQALNEVEYDISIRPDTNNPHYRVWFYFSVSHTARAQKAIFHIVNCSKTRSLFRLGMTPLVRSTSRPRWERIPQKQCFYYKSPRFRKNYVFSFTFHFDREEDTYYFAYCYPYTYTYLQKFLRHIEAQQFVFFDRTLLCRTVQHRRIDLVTITSPEKEAPNGERKKTIFITARVHSGETPASYVCHGLMSFLVSDCPQARALRSFCVFKIVPMLNPDGVFLGNYRCSSMGYDLNRHWLNPNEWAHAPIKGAREAILHLNSSADTQLDFFIDVHAHSTCTNAFMFVNSNDDERKDQAAMLYPRLLAGADRSFSAQASRFCREPSKLGTGRRALGEFLRVAPHCYTLEVSMFCMVDGKQRITPYTEESYLELGRNIACTFCDFYRLPPSLPSPQVMSTSDRERIMAAEKLHESTMKQLRRGTSATKK
eukprot:TRINITY_DN300_c2_g2_i2.p1 TRINITY_DN300_c2_g2~~TRINITY_DN300_c2_g2_i2.p1  ORF type:complete len:439 (+),score=107.14 TRINITY_DN300_c2_g2_i2:124-1440(+)